MQKELNQGDIIKTSLNEPFFKMWLRELSSDGAGTGKMSL